MPLLSSLFSALDLTWSFTFPKSPSWHITAATTCKTAGAHQAPAPGIKFTQHTHEDMFSTSCISAPHVADSLSLVNMTEPAEGEQAPMEVDDDTMSPSAAPRATPASSS